MDISKSVATFVIPHYNEGCEFGRSHLKQAIESIFSQTDDNWQIIIIDDASIDEEAKNYLKELNSSYPGKVNVIFTEVNKGPGIRRNIGVEWAYRNNSLITLFNDADDISHKRRVETVRRIFLEDPEADVVYSTFKVIDENGGFVPDDNLTQSIKEILEGHKSDPVQGKNAWIDIGTEKGYTNLTSATAVRTELAYRQPFPDERVSEDSNTWMRYSADGGKFIYSPEIPSFYRIPQNTEGSSTRSREGRHSFYAQKAEVDEQGFKAAIDIAKNKSLIEEHQIEDLLIKFYIKLAETLCRENEEVLAREQIAKAINISEDKTRSLISGKKFIDWKI